MAASNMNMDKILILLTLWDEKMGPTIHDSNRTVTPERHTIAIQCFMPCIHLFSSGLEKQSGRPPMKLTLPLPHFNKAARIYFGSWEDKTVRGQYRAFGIFFITNEISPLEELLFDVIIEKLDISEELFRNRLILILEESINPQKKTDFEVDTEIKTIKEKLITSDDLISLYNSKELHAIAKKLGVSVNQKSKKKLADGILISLLGLDLE